MMEYCKFEREHQSLPITLKPRHNSCFLNTLFKFHSSWSRITFHNSQTSDKYPNNSPHSIMPISIFSVSPSFSLLLVAQELLAHDIPQTQAISGSPRGIRDTRAYIFQLSARAVIIQVRIIRGKPRPHRGVSKLIVLVVQAGVAFHSVPVLLVGGYMSFAHHSKTYGHCDEGAEFFE